jgi:hypothetical protein
LENLAYQAILVCAACHLRIVEFWVRLLHKVVQCLPMIIMILKQYPKLRCLLASRTLSTISLGLVDIRF